MFKRWCFLYSCCLALRLALALFSPGYIHPDEYFQNVEPALSSLLTLIEPTRTWEFNPSNPCRSMASIRVFNMPVLLLVKGYQTYQRTAELSPPADALFKAQRLNFFVMSLVVDLALYRLLPAATSLRGLLFFASSGATLAFSVRTFSNNVEATLLAVSMLCIRSLWLLYQDWQNSSNVQAKAATLRKWSAMSALLGCVFGLGVFSRFTFAIFALPIGMFYLHLAWLMSSSPATKAQARGLSILFVKPRYGRAFLLTSDLLNGFVLCALAHILYDTFYYRSQLGDEWPLVLDNGWQRFAASLAHRCRFPPIITPVNAFLYNLRIDNLEQHGLHPRWLHALVNAPMLFGISSYLLWIVYACESPALCWPFNQRVSSPTPSPGSSTESFPLNGLCNWSIFVSLAVLSAPPHQEPRFLLPLVFPLYVVLSARRGHTSRLQTLLHLVHSVAFILFFACGHQGGLIPALLDLNRDIRRAQAADSVWSSGSEFHSLTVNVWHTFMPPRHLLLALSPKARNLRNIDLVDHGSKNGKQVISLALQHHLASAAASRPKKQSNLLLAPTWALDTLVDAFALLPPATNDPAPILTGALRSSMPLRLVLDHRLFTSGLDPSSGLPSKLTKKILPSNATLPEVNEYGGRWEATEQHGAYDRHAPALCSVLSYVKYYSPHLDTDHLGEAWCVFRKMHEHLQHSQDASLFVKNGLKGTFHSLWAAYALVLVRIDPCESDL